MAVQLFIILYYNYLLGKQAIINKIMLPIPVITNNAHQGLKPASRNLLTSIPKAGNNNIKPTIADTVPEIRPNIK